MSSDTGESAGEGAAGAGAEENPLVAVCQVDHLAASGKLVIDHAGREVVVFWNGGTPGAMDNACIHRERALAQGVLLNGRVVCPGHQWAFDLQTGWCRERERTQPTYLVEVHDSAVLLSTRPHHT
jgi:nitrite reductase (NADH) small subunit